MFCGCSSLKSLPDISKWKTDNITNIEYLFSGCESLESLPDISKWNTKNIKNMAKVFYLTYLNGKQVKLEAFIAFLKIANL